MTYILDDTLKANIAMEIATKIDSILKNFVAKYISIDDYNEIVGILNESKKNIFIDLDNAYKNVGKIKLKKLYLDSIFTTSFLESCAVSIHKIDMNAVYLANPSKDLYFFSEFIESHNNSLKDTILKYIFIHFTITHVTNIAKLLSNSSDESLYRYFKYVVNDKPKDEIVSILKDLYYQYCNSTKPKLLNLASAFSNSSHIAMECIDLLINNELDINVEAEIIQEFTNDTEYNNDGIIDQLFLFNEKIFWETYPIAVKKCLSEAYQNDKLNIENFDFLLNKYERAYVEWTIEGFNKNAREFKIDNKLIRYFLHKRFKYDTPEIQKKQIRRVQRRINKVVLKYLADAPKENDFDPNNYNIPNQFIDYILREYYELKKKELRIRKKEYNNLKKNGGKDYDRDQ